MHIIWSRWGTRRTEKTEGQGDTTYNICQDFEIANHNHPVSKSCKHNSSLHKHKHLESWIHDIMERRNEAFQKVRSVMSAMLMISFLLRVAQTNLHRPQPVDLSVCGQQQKCRQHHQNSGNIIADIRRNHYTTRCFWSQVSRLCLLSCLTGSQSEPGFARSGYGSMFAMSLHSDLERLDD